MLTRIQKIMDEKGLSLSAFADEINVKRPTMTHTMSGRNNPSLEIVSKILDRFKDINSDWVLFGSGSMYKSTIPFQQNLFDTEEDSPVVKSDSNSIIQKSIEAPQKNLASIQIDQDFVVQKSKECDKKISKILIFFSDNTFETFIPESTSKK